MPRLANPAFRGCPAVWVRDVGDLTSCTGMCDRGPALLVNNRPITRLIVRRVDEICTLVRSDVPLAEWPADFFRVEDNIRRADALLGSRHESG